MMERSYRRGARVVLILLIAGITHPAGAFENEDGPSYARGSLSKLGRGLANIVTAPAELIREPQRVALREGSGRGYTRGVAQGVGRTLLRAVVGVFEVVTFYAEVPEDFAPLMTPEFAFQERSWTD